MSTVVYYTFPTLHGGSPENTLTVPLRNKTVNRKHIKDKDVDVLTNEISQDE